MLENQDKKRKVLFIALVTLILLFALFLRMYNLEKFSLWADEPYHLYISQSIMEDGSLKLPSGEIYFRAKLFSYITALSTSVFGLNEFAVRLPTAFFGFLSLLLLFFFSRKLLGNSVATVSLILLAVLPLEVGWARVARFYTLFQFFTILVWYTFFIGFLRNNNALGKRKISGNFNVLNIIKSWEINWLFLLLFFVSLMIAVSTQIIGALLLLPIFIFIVLYAIYVFVRVDLKTFFVSKYFAVPICAILLFAIVYILLPQINSMLKEGLTYIPSFAKNVGALDRTRFLKYIMGKDIFPLGVLFAFGTIQAVLRMNKVVVYSALFFIIPVFLFTFVFSYRLYQYIYNVIPFFVLVAGYGLINIVNMEGGKFKRANNFLSSSLSKYVKNTKVLVVLFFLLLLISTPFFVEGLSIPFNNPGESNGAVTFREWKEASDYLKEEADGSEIILTTLPLAIKYYYGRVDYDMNLDDVEIAKQNVTMDSTNRLYDFYSGIYFITEPTQLDQLTKNNPSGYIVVDTFRLITTQYISKEMAQYIEDNLQLVFLTPYKTVRVYIWNHQE
jgi:4-amino-4-deoxy-L-arabinose transferase-like glycosyltransferase